MVADNTFDFIFRTENHRHALVQAGRFDVHDALVAGGSRAARLLHPGDAADRLDNSGKHRSGSDARQNPPIRYRGVSTGQAEHLLFSMKDLDGSRIGCQPGKSTEVVPEI